MEEVPLVTISSSSDENQIGVRWESSGDEAGETVSLEDALDRVGFGRMHWYLLTLCGAGFASGNQEFMLLNFLLSVMLELAEQFQCTKSLSSTATSDQNCFETCLIIANSDTDGPFLMQ